MYKLVEGGALEKPRRSIIESGLDPKNGCKMQCEMTAGVAEHGDQRASAWILQVLQPKLPFDLQPSDLIINLPGGLPFPSSHTQSNLESRKSKEA